MSIFQRFVGCALVLVLLALVPAASQAVIRFVNPDGLCGGNLPCYTTIQAAIDASGPGDVISVQAAVHSPAAKINVHTSVKIWGAQAGMDPLPSQGSTRVPGSAAESIIDGAAAGLSGIIVITADNVILDGLEIRNGSGDLVDSEIGTPTAGTIIRNCIIHDSSGDEGVQLRNVDTPLVTCNLVYNTGGDGINVCCGSTNGAIRYNELHDINSPDAAIYVYNATNTTIEGNLVTNSTQNDGIKLGSKNGSDAASSGGSVISNTVSTTAQDGITVYTSDVLVECNDVSGSTSENGGIYVAYAVSNVTITNNNVHDNNFNVAKWGDPAGIMIGTAPNNATVTVTNNNITNNVPNGVTNKAAGVLTASGNWWGDASGPSGAGAGSGDAVSTNVNFAGWLAGPANYDCPVIDDECATTVPVTLAYVSISRVEKSAVLHWQVNAPAIEYAGFHVYREQEGGGMEKLSQDMLFGERYYEFIDPAAPTGKTDYWLAEIEDGGTEYLHGPISLAPAGIVSFALEPSYPNPFNPTTTIGFTLDKAGIVQLRIYDAQGRLVRTLASGHETAGRHVRSWDALDDSGERVTSGVYFARLEFSGRVQSQKLVLLK